MDYIDIILRGYSNENDRQNLSKYFIRECKKAEKDYYDVDVFFSGLFNGIKRLKKEFETRFYERENELHFMLNEAKNGTLRYGQNDNKSIEERYKETIDYCELELSTISFENFPTNLLHFTKDRYRGFLYYSEVEFISNEITQALKEFQKPKQRNAKNENVLTNDTYYSVLENCTIEAFECLALKDLYPQDGNKAIWDISTLTITKGNGQPEEREKELFRKQYIKENMSTTFLIALDRHRKVFESKHSISREVFYKKCYQSLLLKISESPLWKKPDFSFDIDAEPCVLTFIWSMRFDIEAQGIDRNEPQQKQSEIKNHTEKDLTTQKWFKTGIALATGEAFEIYRELGANNPTEICRKIGVPTSNKTYVSATLTDKDENKNLFSDPKKLKALHKHLTENNLHLGTEFLEKYNQIEPD